MKLTSKIVSVALKELKTGINVEKMSSYLVTLGRSVTNKKSCLKRKKKIISEDELLG